MPGYVKIWTDLRNDSWFRRLPLVARGLWYELICLCKERGDIGTISYKNVTQLASEVNAERRTIVKWLTVFRKDGKIIWDNSQKNVMTIGVSKYGYWQDLTLKEQRQELKDKRRNGQENYGKFTALLSEQSKAEHCGADNGNGAIKPNASPTVSLLDEERIDSMPAGFSDWSHHDKSEWMTKQLMDGLGGKLV